MRRFTLPVVLLLCVVAGGCASSRWAISRPQAGDTKDTILLDTATGDTWFNHGNDNHWTKMNRR